MQAALPSRAIPRLVAETQALFLVKAAAGVCEASRAVELCLDQLCRSGNAAIANEALRLRGADRAINHDEVL